MVGIISVIFTLTTLPLDISNSFIIQFGSYTSGTQSFPTTFTSFARMGASGEYSWGGVNNLITAITKTGFTAQRGDNYGTTYVAVGC